MGITIHYRMIADDPRTVIAALKIVREEAEKAGYRYAEVEGEGIVFMDVSPVIKSRESAAEWLEEAWGGYAERRFDEVPEEPPFTWLEEDKYGTPFFIWKEIADRSGFKGKPVEGEGIVVYCDTAESFNPFFWKLGDYYVCTGFTKTQPFTAEEVEPNTRWHKWICRVLKRLEKLPWWSFYVHDETGYYETMDEKKIAENFEVVSRMIWAVSSAIQEAIDEAGLPWRGVVGGKHDVKEMRDKLKRYGGQTRVEDHDDRQTRLDDFEGGGPHRLWTRPKLLLLMSPRPGLYPLRDASIAGEG